MDIAPSSQWWPHFHAKQWELLEGSPETDNGFVVEIVLVHNYIKNSNRALREQLERAVTTAVVTANKLTGVNFHLNVYRFHDKTVCHKGEFTAVFGELLGYVQKLVGGNSSSSRSRRASQTHLQSELIHTTPPSEVVPKILFVTSDLGAWLVRKLFQDNESASVVRQLGGIIFIGADHLEDFEYIAYLKTRTQSDSSEAQSVRYRSSLAKTLQSVDNGFKRYLGQSLTNLASTTWILPPLGSISPDQFGGPLSRSGSRNAISRMRNMWRKQRQPDAFERPTSFISVTSQVINEDLISNDKASIGATKLGRHVLQQLVVTHVAATATEEDTIDERQYRYPYRLEVSIGNEEDLEASLPSLNQTVTEDSRRYMPHDTHDFPLVGGESESVPRSPVESNNDDLTQSFSQLGYSHYSETTWSVMEPSLGRDGTEDVSIEQDRAMEQLRMDIEDRLSSAQAHLKMGDFDKAERYYVKCSRILSRATLHNQLQSYRELSLTVSVQKALLTFQKGRYEDARDDLLNLKESAGKHDLRISYHLAVVLTRLGDHHGAFQQLQDLRQRTWFKKTVWSLNQRDTPPSSLLEDDGVETVLGATRLEALLWGYYGHYQSAKGFMEWAETRCEKYLHASRATRVQSTPSMETLTQQDGWATPGRELTSQARLGHQPIEPKAIKAKIDMARAKIQMLEGNNDSALHRIRRTLRVLERQLGKKDIVTLEAAALNALIMSRTFDREAESVCMKAINAMSQSLGREHPLTMEVLSTLVNIFLIQSRPYEALDTANALFEQGKDNLRPDNPQTLRYLCQLGEVNLYMGNYQQAEEELKEVCGISEDKWKDKAPLGKYPDVLKYTAKLALTHCYMGKFTTARHLAKEALVKQAKLFRNKNEAGDGVELEVSHIDSIFDKLNLERDEGFEISPHPDILDSLASYATIMNKSGRAGPEVFDTFQLLYEWKKNFHGPRHYLTLKCGLQFAWACLGTKEAERLGDPAEFFGILASDCERHLGLNHAFTWRAQLGSLFTSGGLYEPAKFISEASRILEGQIAHLGDSHPTVLDSLQRIFVAELMIADKSAHDTAKLLLTQVRKPKLREQRLMETLHIEKRIAELYCAIESYEEGIPIYEKVRKFHETHRSGREDLTLELDSFWKLFEAEYEAVRQKAEQLRVKKVMDGNRATDGGEYHKQRAASLAKALYSKSDKRTVDAFESLAEVLYASRIPQKRVEGLTVLDDLLTGIRKVKFKNGGDEIDELLERISDKYNAWQHELYRDSGHYPQSDHYEQSDRYGQSDLRPVVYEMSGYNGNHALRDSKGKSRAKEELWR